jgi:hypothetical protein
MWNVLIHKRACPSKRTLIKLRVGAFTEFVAEAGSHCLVLERPTR